MKIVYAGTPDFAVAPLENLIKAGFCVVGVVTQTDKPQGRKGILTPPPVKVKAEEYGIPVFQPEKIRDFVSELRALKADVMVTCAYGQILTQDVLDVFEKGVWNIHAGLLPFYRGASPIQSCILNGETQTGVSILKTELGLDSGPILLVEKTDIENGETCGELSARLSLLGAKAIVSALNKVNSGDFTLLEQGEDGVNTVRKIGKEHAKIDFFKSADEIVNLVRAMNPAPLAYASVNGLKINVFTAEKADDIQAEESVKVGEIVSDIPKKGLIVKCGNGFLKILELQPSGGKKMRASDFLNGRKVKKGDVFNAD